MTDITPVPELGPIPLLGVDDLAEGGPEGRANAQARALANAIQWLLAKGAGATFDPSLTYLPGAVSVKDGRLQIFDGANWSNFGLDDGALRKSSNLLDLPDKATARSNLDVYPTAVIDAMNTTIPLGVVWFWTGTRSAIPDSCVAYDGDVVNRADYPDLWADIAAGRYHTVSEAVWLASSASRGKFSTGDGATTFRFPDLNGVKSGSLKSPVLRGDGYAPGGSMLGDAIREISGGLGVTRAIAGGGAGAFEAGASATNAEGTGSVGAPIREFNFKASRVVPTADENRPNSAFGVWIGKVRGGTRSTPAEGSPATLLANEYLGMQKIVGPLEVTGSYTGDLFPNVKAALNAEGDAPISAIRGLVIGSAAGAPTMLRSLNVGSVTKPSSPEVTLNFIKPMSNTNYIVLAFCKYGLAPEELVGGTAISKTVSSCTIKFRIPGAQSNNTPEYSVVIL